MNTTLLVPSTNPALKEKSAKPQKCLWGPGLRNFVHSLLAAKWVFDECYVDVWRYGWVEVESIQELRRCIGSLNQQRLQHLKNISLYIQHATYLAH
jgi:hypothetical protein